VVQGVYARWRYSFTHLPSLTERSTASEHLLTPQAVLKSSGHELALDTRIPQIEAQRTLLPVDFQRELILARWAFSGR